MDCIPFEVTSDGRAFVKAQIRVGEITFLPPLRFLVDTAAEVSFITGPAENRLRAQSNADVLKFTEGIKPIETMLGQAPVKCLVGTEAAPLALVLATVDDLKLTCTLPYLYFGTRDGYACPSLLKKPCRLFSSKPDSVWDSAGVNVEHCIMGRDVLSQFMIVVNGQGRIGYLVRDNTPNALATVTGGWTAASAYNDRVQATDFDWI